MDYCNESEVSIEMHYGDRTNQISKSDSITDMMLNANLNYASDDSNSAVTSIISQLNILASKQCNNNTNNKNNSIEYDECETNDYDLINDQNNNANDCIYDGDYEDNSQQHHCYIEDGLLRLTSTAGSGNINHDNSQTNNSESLSKISSHKSLKASNTDTKENRNNNLQQIKSSPEFITNDYKSVSYQQHSKQLYEKMGQGSLINSKNHNNPLLNQDEASSARQQLYDTNVKQFLDAKKKEFEEKFKNNGASKNPQAAKETTGFQLDPKNVKLDDFDLDRTIGTGSFGRVMIVNLKRDRNQRYAMKMLKKENIVKMKQVEHTLNERKILGSIDFPFIVQLAYSFKDTSNLYMVLEYVSGGEMFTHLRKTGRYSEENACFYASQIVLTFEYLHHLNIVYRDLKPENVLYDSNGYVKITDFGFAKIIKDRTWTLCGTPEYLAPEIILSRGYNKAVDWWALGVIIYEMTAGYPPFFAENPIQIYEKIVSGHLRFPSHFSVNLKDLLKNLLQVDLTKRVGNLKNGVADVKQHKWFQNADWMAVYERRVKAPYLPKEEYEQYDEEPLYISSTEKYAKEFAEF